MWRDKYKKINLSVNSVNEFLNSFKNILKVNRVAGYLLPHLFGVVTNNLIAEDVIFSMNLVKEDMFCILPTISKVRNYGHDGSGVNCGVDKENVFVSQRIDTAKSFDFSTPVDNVSENEELTNRLHKKLKASNVIFFEIIVLFLARNTRLYEYYRKVKKIIKHKIL